MPVARLVIVAARGGNRSIPIPGPVSVRDAETQRESAIVISTAAIVTSTVAAATIDRAASAAEPARVAGETSPASMASAVTLRQSGDRTTEQEQRSCKQCCHSGFFEYSE